MSAIDDKYTELGGSEFFGLPVGSEATAHNGGRYRHYEGGSIYWHPTTGAFEVHGAIRDKWAELGWERSFLGYPLTDETSPPDSPDHNKDHNRGRFNHFQGGSIYWTLQTGAHEVHGAIREFWANQGWEQGGLGYPMSDELSAPGGGKYSVFEGGVVYRERSRGAGIANSFDYPKEEIIKMVNDLIKRQIRERNAPLYFDNATELTKVHHWYEWGGKYHYRVMELDLDMGVDVNNWFDPEVDIDLFLTFEAKDGNIIVSLIRGKYRADSNWWQEILSLGFQEILDHIANNRLGETLDQVIGQRFEISDAQTLFAAQLQDNGDLRIFLPPIRL